MMEVSMDGLRNQLLRNYNSLVRKLNSNIKDESWDPHVTIDVESIQSELDSIRSCIVTLAFTHMEGEGGWKSMDDDTKFVLFNPQDDEEEE
jgi:hypothetical protein